MLYVCVYRERERVGEGEREGKYIRCILLMIELQRGYYSVVVQ